VDCQGRLISRTELAEKAQRAGLNITARTLRYWASVGLIPKPVYGERGKALYPEALLDELRVIDKLRKPRSISAIKEWLEKPVIEELSVGEKRFQIIANLGKSFSQGREYSLKLTRCGQYVLSIKSGR